jgi:hypothetical protein
VCRWKFWLLTFLRAGSGLQQEVSLQALVQLVGHHSGRRCGSNVGEQLDEIKRERPQREVPEGLLTSDVQPDAGGEATGCVDGVVGVAPLGAAGRQAVGQVLLPERLLELLVNVAAACVHDHRDQGGRHRQDRGREPETLLRGGQLRTQLRKATLSSGGHHPPGDSLLLVRHRGSERHAGS